MKENNNCKYFSRCGGCELLHLSQDEYKNYKKALLQSYNNIIQIEPNWIWIGAKTRRKITLQSNKQNELGFFANKSRELVEIDECFIAKKEISNLIIPLKNLVKKLNFNSLSKITITFFDNGLDILFFTSKEFSNQQSQKILEFAQKYNVNISNNLNGEIFPILMLRKNQIYFDNLKINLDSDIFIQATGEGSAKISKIIYEFLAKNPNLLRIADIYSGFGSYAFAISSLVKSISAFEGSPKMTSLITKNANQNGLNSKISGINRDLFLNPIKAKELEKFDLVLINPPRTGANPQILQIAESNLKNLIYISCNPKTFFADAKILLKKNFKVESFYAIDQFYGTNHIETITIFTKL